MSLALITLFTFSKIAFNEYEDNKNRYRLAAMAGLILLSTSCVNKFLPEDLDSFDQDAGFTQLVYKPKLGRTTVYTDNYNTANSTLPLTFEITSITNKDGSPAPELTQSFR